jgi:hypothetical protein
MTKTPRYNIRISIDPSLVELEAQWTPALVLTAQAWAPLHLSSLHARTCLLCSSHQSLSPKKKSITQSAAFFLE